MVGGDEGRGEEYALVVWVLVDLIDVLHDDLVLLLLGGGEEEDVALHAVDEETRDYLNIRIRLLDSLQVLLAVVLARIEDHSLCFVSPLLPEVVIAGDEVIEFLHVLD